MIICSRRRNFVQLLILSFFGIFIINEYLVYYIASFSWPDVKCGDIHQLHSVLLVADPQILGEQSEPWLARWDNDRYLQQSFGLALRHVQPDLVIFLGDLMDEGSVATDDEYHRYLLRFRSIFQLDYLLKNKTLFIPGDNDIGGEDELVTDKKVLRFKTFFSSPPVYNLGSLQIVQVDKMQRIVPAMTVENNVTRVVVSHMPLLGMPSAFAAEVLQKLRPHLVLSAHDHKSVHFSADIESGERMLVESLLSNRYADNAPTWRFQTSEHTVNELVVPTCSYRMGVADMGFGVALIDERGEAWCYHMLWLPSRFKAITFYLFTIAVTLISVLSTRCCPSLWTRHKFSPRFIRS